MCWIADWCLAHDDACVKKLLFRVIGSRADLCARCAITIVYSWQSVLGSPQSGEHWAHRACPCAMEERNGCHVRGCSLTRGLRNCPKRQGRGRQHSKLRRACGAPCSGSETAAQLAPVCCLHPGLQTPMNGFKGSAVSDPLESKIRVLNSGSADPADHGTALPLCEPRGASVCFSAQ